MAKSFGGVRYSHSEPSADLKEFRAYSRDWEKTYFDHATGGFVVTDRDRIPQTKEKNGKIKEPSRNEREKFEKEQTMCKDLAQSGFHVEHLTEMNRPAKRTYDIDLNGTPAELKSVSSGNNVEKYARTASREQGAKIAVFRIEKGAGVKNTKEIIRRLHISKAKYGIKIIYYAESGKKMREI